MRLAKRLERHQPPVKLLAADPEWILLTLVGPGDEAVE
jgi:hypothetical protein